MLYQSLKMALHSILSNKLRSFLTMLGIIIGVLALVVLVSIADGATTTVTDVVNSLGSDLLSVQIFDDKGNPLKYAELEDLKSLPEMGLITPNGTDLLNVSANGISERGTINGVTAGFFTIQDVPLDAGRYFNTVDEQNHLNVAIINHSICEKILKTDDAGKAIGQTIRIAGFPFTVIGVQETSDAEEMSQMSGMSRYSVYLPYPTLMRISNTVGNIRSFYCKPGPDSNLDELEKALNKWCYKRFGQDEDAYYVMNLTTILDAINTVASAMQLMIGAIAAVSLLVGGIGIMNIMLVSVTERTREIGIRKAIGADEGSILIQFLIEATMLSLLGCLLGICASYGLIQFINFVSDRHFIMSPKVVLIASIFSTAIGLIFGLYPARKAARKKPIDALHFGG